MISSKFLPKIYLWMENYHGDTNKQTNPTPGFLKSWSLVLPQTTTLCAKGLHWLGTFPELPAHEMPRELPGQMIARVN